jgi:hypothetical protein
MLLALGQADLHLDPPARVVQVERHQRVAGTLDLADQLGDLRRVQQQLAGAGRVGLDMGRGLGQRRDVRADQVQLGTAHDHVALLELRAPGADRLHFPSLECDARLDALFDEEVVGRFFVLNDAHV